MNGARATSLAIVASLGGCTCAGCGETFRWSADLPDELTYEEIRALDVLACRNDVCIEGPLDELEPDEPLRGGSTQFVSIDGGLTLELAREIDGSYRVDLSWFDRPVTDGDHYRVEVRDPSGAAVIGIDETVDYREYRANGPLDPGVCRTVVIDRSSSDAGR